MKCDAATALVAAHITFQHMPVLRKLLIMAEDEKVEFFEISMSLNDGEEEKSGKKSNHGGAGKSLKQHILPVCSNDIRRPENLATLTLVMM
mmetsp:Transcript_18877/g.31210  ORF Transcript_18877/g.31210 Transcript_18877/m.31210 type:complete len:91 (+) Transcript_18877:824-1096(+)